MSLNWLQTIAFQKLQNFWVFKPTLHKKYSIHRLKLTGRVNRMLYKYIKFSSKVSKSIIELLFANSNKTKYFSCCYNSGNSEFTVSLWELALSMVFKTDWPYTIILLKFRAIRKSCIFLEWGHSIVVCLCFKASLRDGKRFMRAWFDLHEHFIWMASHFYNAKMRFCTRRQSRYFGSWGAP